MNPLNFFKISASLCIGLFLMLYSFAAAAQNQATPMADGLRSEGKIYVVVLVLATIFAGIIAYLIHLDRKLSRLEKEAKLP